jgi:exoribonuclease II
MNLLACLQEQQARAVEEGDRRRLNRVVSLQTLAWAYVRTFAEQLVQRGEAPADLAERLRRSLRIAPAQDRQLQALRSRSAPCPLAPIFLDDERLAA